MIIEPDENRKKYLPAVGMALFFIVGFMAAYLLMNIKVKNASKDCAARLAQSQKEDSGLPQAPAVKAPSEFFSASGKVENIDGQKISLKSSTFGKEITYQITVGEGTKIIKREMDLSPPKEGSEKAPAEPKVTDASLSDIRVGDSLTADSADNIKDKTEFTAKTVYIEITTGLPAPPAAPDINSVPAAPAPGGSTTAPPAPTAPSASEVPVAPAAPNVPGAPPAPK